MVEKDKKILDTIWKHKRIAGPYVKGQQNAIKGKDGRGSLYKGRSINKLQNSVFY